VGLRGSGEEVTTGLIRAVFVETLGMVGSGVGSLRKNGSHVAREYRVERRWGHGR
jgi:hypothetical protein